jgi:hypothetical protein
MSDILVYAVISALGSLCSGIMTYVIAKKLTGTDSLMQKTDEFLSKVRDSPEMQQKIASLGMLVGVGIKQGVGLGKGTGKRSLESTIVEGLMGYFMPKLAPGTQGEPAKEGSVFG